MHLGDICKDFDLDMSLDHIYSQLARKSLKRYGDDAEDVVTILDYFVPYSLLDTGIELKKIEILAEYQGFKMKLGDRLKDEEVENFNKFIEMALKNFIVSESKLKHLGEINLLNGVEIGLDLRGKSFKDCL